MLVLKMCGTRVEFDALMRAAEGWKVLLVAGAGFTNIRRRRALLRAA
jgi:hypothetical protein